MEASSVYFPSQLSCYPTLFDKSHLLKFCLEGLHALSFQSFIQNNQAVMTICHADAAAKRKIKWHADMKYRAKPSNLKVDDIVLCRQQKNGKLCSAFEPQLYKVISVKRPMITTLSGICKITRNLSHFKVLCSSKSHTERKGGGNKMDDSWEFNIPGQTKTVTPATPPSPASGLQPPTSEIKRYPEREHRGPPMRLADYEIQSI